MAIRRERHLDITINVAVHPSAATSTGTYDEIIGKLHGELDQLAGAGADEIVSPYGLTGRRMAVLAVQPSVLEVLDLLNLGSDIRLEEVSVRAGTHLDNLTVAEARARYAGVAILALKKPGSEVSANPNHEVRLAPGGPGRRPGPGGDPEPHGGLIAAGARSL